jgi:hypothetical protein
LHIIAACRQETARMLPLWRDRLNLD